MIGLTKSQRQVLTYLREYIGQNGEAPTIREIKEALRLSSTSAVWLRLEALEERGHIDRAWHTPRGIFLRDPPIIINGQRYRFIPITPGVVNPLRIAA